MKRFLTYDNICFISSLGGGILFTSKSKSNSDYKEKIINFSIGNTVGFLMGITYPISYPLIGLYGSYELYKNMIK